MKRTTSAILAMCLLLLAGAQGRAVTPSGGCGLAAPDSGIHSMEHGELSRHYRLLVPAGYHSDQPARLAVIFHGWGGDEDVFLDDPAVIAEANARGYILVAPRGLGSAAPDARLNSWSFSGSTTGLDGDGVNADIAGDTAAICNLGVTPDYRYPSCSGIAENTCSWTQCQDDDSDFALALVARVAADLCVDLDNVFASGGSNGGMLTWTLGQSPVTAPTFRALAPLIGLPHRGYLAGPGKAAEMPVLVITGSEDRTVPPGAWESSAFTTTTDNDRFHYTGATAITRAWAAAHGCPTDAPAAPFDAGFAQSDCRSYCSNDAGWPPVLDCRAAMGHVYELQWTWPLIMDFFDAHAAN